MSSLLLSVPPAELARVQIPASIFEIERLRAAPISLALRRALNVIFQSVAPQYEKTWCVVRPEIFTHGVSRAWLQERIPGVGDHLALSNGQTLKGLRSLRNTVFVYGLDQRAAQMQYRNLLWRAPDLLGTFERQINGQHPFGKNALGKLPETLAMPLKVAPPVQDLTWYYPLYWNRHSAHDSTERMLAWGRTDQPTFSGCERLTLVACTDGGLQDARFCHSLAQLVADAAKSPSCGVLIGLPSFEDISTSTSQRLDHVLAALARGGFAIPRARLSRVVICTDIQEGEWLDSRTGFDILLHDSFPLWAYTPKFYAKARIVKLSRSRAPNDEGTLTPELEEVLLGRTPESESWSADFQARMGLG